jgi:hypothetical protein
MTIIYRAGIEEGIRRANLPPCANTNDTLHGSNEAKRKDIP